jgi:hypothetical protein
MTCTNVIHILFKYKKFYISMHKRLQQLQHYDIFYSRAAALVMIYFDVY